MVEDDELCLILEEPNLEDDFDAWSAWFEALKQGKEELGRFMQGLGVRPLPPAVLGGGWGDPTPKPVAVDDCAVVHGQHTGGW